MIDKKKEMIVLSFIAYQGFWETDPQKVKNLVENTLSMKLLMPFIGKQELVWGPARTKGKQVFDVAMMYAVNNKSNPSEYTVVIRGTNPISLWSWWNEDLKIIKQIPWEYGKAPAQAKISQASHTALHLLQDLKPEESIPGAGQTINAFLQDIINSGKAKTIYVTGHSLGGCMAPTLALWLKDTLTGIDDIDLSVYAYAGPTAGNGTFAQYSNSRLTNCIRYANHYDIAVHWCNEEALLELDNLYEPYISPSEAEKKLIAATAKAAKDKDYTQIDSLNDVPGDVYTVIKEYLAQAIYQHTFPYLYLVVAKEQAPAIVKAVGMDSLLEESTLANYKEDLY